MKSLTCDLCEYEVQAETFEEWMEAMKPHYAQVHGDFMKQMSEKPREEQMAQMQKWMTEARARFEAA